MIQRLQDIYYDTEKRTLMRRTQGGTEVLLFPDGEIPKLELQAEPGSLITGGDGNGSLRIYARVLGVDVTDSCELFAVGAGISGSFGTGVDRNLYSVTGLSANICVLGVNVTHANYGTASLNIQISKQSPEPIVRTLRSSAPVLVVKADGTVAPASVIFSAMEIQGQAVSPYTCYFKLYKDDVLYHETTTPSTALMWTPDVVQEVNPGPETYPGLNLYPTFSNKVIRCEIWTAASGGSKIDSIDIAVQPSWQGYIQNELATVAPKYRGRYEASHPASYDNGDSWIVYDTDDSPIQRGFYLAVNYTPQRITGASEMALQAKLAEALTDVAWAEANGYGTAANYGIEALFQSLAAVTAFINSLSANTALIQSMLAHNITLLAQGYLQSYNYAESGGVPTAGFKLDVANQVIKAFGAIFKQATIQDAIITNASVSGVFNGPTIPCLIIDTGTTTKGAFFSWLSPYVPNVGDKRQCSGSLRQGSTGTKLPSYVERINSTTIRIYITNIVLGASPSVSNTYEDMISGNTDSYWGRLAL